VFVFGVICIVFMVLLVVRLLDIQYRQGPRLRRLAVQEHIKRIIIDRKRGNISDRNGRVLAVSMKVPSLFVDPSQVKDADHVILSLSQHVEGISPEGLKKAVTRNGLFSWVERKMEPERAEKIKELNLKGVYFQKEYKRYYPRGNMAANLMGFAGMDDRGLEGIEFYYDKVMRCDSGYAEYKGDIRGYEIPESERIEKSPEGGFDLVLTLDEVVQHIVEEEIGRVFEEFDPNAAMGIVMNPNTGEIIAMSTFPSYDLNKFSTVPAAIRRNKVITDMFEPGSTFKLITAAAAIEEGLVTGNDHFVCDGAAKIGPFTIRCHASHGEQTFTEIIANSCNEGIIEVAKKVGKKRFWNYIDQFGFGKRTGIDLPGEVTGRVISYKRWADLDLGAISMGQAVGVTALQMISAVSAILNGGELVEPRVVMAVADPETGRVVRRFSKNNKARVISSSTAAEIIKIMQEVVIRGTGRRAALENYILAGKTGTAQKIDRETGKYSNTKVISSFVGGGPFPDPQFVIMVIVDEPKGKGASTGMVAVEPFKRIAERALNYLALPPSIAAGEESESSRWTAVEAHAPDLPSASAVPDENVQYMMLVPRFLGMGKAGVESIAKRNGLNVEVGGHGSRVVYQFPDPDTPVLPDTRVIVYFGSSSTRPVPLAGKMMPCLVGKTMMESSQRLKALPVQVRFLGSGLAYAQEPVPGTPIETGAEVKVFFSSD